MMQANRAGKRYSNSGSSSGAISYMGTGRRHDYPTFESISHATVVLTTRHTVVEDAKAVFQGTQIDLMRRLSHNSR
jgi:hypothetical protein